LLRVGVGFRSEGSNTLEVACLIIRCSQAIEGLSEGSWAQVEVDVGGSTAERLVVGVSAHVDGELRHQEMVDRCEGNLSCGILELDESEGL
jgi:hypothetical protein